MICKIIKATVNCDTRVSFWQNKNLYIIPILFYQVSEPKAGGYLTTTNWSVREGFCESQIFQVDPSSQLWTGAGECCQVWEQVSVFPQLGYHHYLHGTNVKWTTTNHKME